MVRLSLVLSLFGEFVSNFLILVLVLDILVNLDGEIDELVLVNFSLLFISLKCSLLIKLK